MRKISTLSAIQRSGKRIFTTRELSLLSGKSVSVITQSLNNLAKQGVIVKIYRGLWTREGDVPVSAYEVIPYLFPRHRVYVSFISALHLHGMIEQIPQVITLASTAHAKMIRTAVGVFCTHRIAASFFIGFGWYKGSGNFLIAEPEKALADSLYLSAYKKKRFGHFPELHLPDSFDFKKLKGWVNKIPATPARICVQKKLKQILRSMG